MIREENSKGRQKKREKKREKMRGKETEKRTEEKTRERDGVTKLTVTVSNYKAEKQREENINLILLQLKKYIPRLCLTAWTCRYPLRDELQYLCSLPSISDLQVLSQTRAS